MACSGSHRARGSISATIGPFLEMYGIKMTQEHGRFALHAILRAANYSFRRPRKPLRIILQLGKLTLNHFRTLLHSLDNDLIRSRGDSGKLPIHIDCETNAPVEVLALLSELNPATLQIADHSGAMPIHECCRGIAVYSNVRYLVEQGGVGTLAARDREGAVPLPGTCLVWIHKSVTAHHPIFDTILSCHGNGTGQCGSISVHDCSLRIIYCIAECGLRTCPGAPRFTCSRE